MGRKAGILCLFGFAVTFAGLNLSLRQAGILGIPALVLVVAGLLAGSILCFPFFGRHVSRSGWPLMDRRYLIDLVILVVTASVIPFWLQVEGFQRTTASKGGIILSLIPVLTAVFSRLILARKVTPALVLRIALMFGGGALISWEGGPMGVNLGDIMLFGTAASLALSMVIAHRLLKDWPIHVVIQARLSLGLILLVPLVLVLEPLSGWTHPDLLWLGFLSGFLLLASLYGVYYGLMALGPEFSTLFDIVAAMLTVMGAYLLFAETLLLNQLMGGAIILGTAAHLVWNIWHGKEDLVKSKG